MAEFVELLGLQKRYDEAKEEEVIGAGGLFKSRRLTMDSIDLLKGPNPFCSLKNASVLVPPPRAIPYVVLGRNTIFREHDIMFRENQKHMIFRWPPKK